MKNHYEVKLRENQTVPVELQADGDGFRVSIEGQSHEVKLLGGDGEKTLVVELNGRRVEVQLRPHADAAKALQMDGISVKAPAAPKRPSGSAPASAAQQKLLSPITGVLQAILAEPGDLVEAGAPLAIVEAMKMENTVSASGPARVEKILVQPGSPVRSGEAILILQPQT